MFVHAKVGVARPGRARREEVSHPLAIHLERAHLHSRPRLMTMVPPQALLLQLVLLVLLVGRHAHAGRAVVVTCDACEQLRADPGDETTSVFAHASRLDGGGFSSDSDDVPSSFPHHRHHHRPLIINPNPYPDDLVPHHGVTLARPRVSHREDAHVVSSPRAVHRGRTDFEVHVLLLLVVSRGGGSTPRVVCVRIVVPEAALEREILGSARRGVGDDGDDLAVNVNVNLPLFRRESAQPVAPPIVVTNANASAAAAA